MDLNQQSQPLEIKHKILEQNDLFINAAESTNMTLLRHVDKVKSNVHELGVLFDEDSQKRAVNWTDKKKQKALRRFKLLRTLFKQAKNSDDLRGQIDNETKKLKACKESNFCAIYLQTKPFEKSIRALELLHKNRDGQGRVKIIPVTPKRFVNTLNNFHLNTILKDDLEEAFYDWDIDKSPLYITYLGEIAEKSVIQELADMAAKTLALALVDVPSHDNISSFLEFAEDFDIKGIDESLGHLVLPATQLVIEDCLDYDIGEKDGLYYKKKTKYLAIPAGASMMGALLASEPGVPITGKAGRGVKGTSGTVMAYNKKRLDSAALSKKGFIMIDKGKIFGARTANNSDKRELHHFPKVDTRNTIGKTLIQFSNDVAFGNWGAEELLEFTTKIKKYLNNQKRSGVIESYGIDPESIYFDPNTNRVYIKITIKYKELVEGIDFELEGTPGEIVLKP